MKSSPISIATVLISLVSGCQDAKLKECVAKVESLEEKFELSCEGLGEYYDIDPKLIEAKNDLYDLVQKRNEAWAEAGCNRYQASWICQCNWGSDSLGKYSYTASFDYE